MMAVQIAMTMMPMPSLTMMVQMLATTMAPKIDARAIPGAMIPGDTLRSRAIRYNLAALDFRFYPCRLHSLGSFPRCA